MAEPILQLTGVTKRFGALVATDDVTLDLRPGEIHALIGPNGAGKSTLIAQIAGSLAPDAGRVAFAGRDVTDLPAPARARAGLARTFQISTLPGGHSVLQIALLAALSRSGAAGRLWRPASTHAEAHRAAHAALSRVGLDAMAQMRAADLSHGQRRQAEIAAALALGPRAFLMDEPMAGLGVDGTAAMTQVLSELRHEAPILLVEHDMDAVFALADRISVLVSGRIIATGPPQAIRADPAVQAAYLGPEAAA